MKTIIAIFAVCALVTQVRAEWFWPFGSDGASKGSLSGRAGEEKEEKRLSELMERASLIIDEAADLADQGDISQAIKKYGEALEELDRVERANPERAKTSEFSSLRTKRAYTRSAIASLQMKEAVLNAKPVAVTDTKALEKKLADEKKAEEEKKSENVKKSENEKNIESVKETEEKKEPVKETADEKKALLPDMLDEMDTSAAKPAPSARSRRDIAVSDIRRGDYAAAHLVIAEMLNEKPDDALALNLFAIACSGTGRFDEAEDALLRCIKHNPDVYSTYFNMARIYLKKSPPDKEGARRYYETGRLLGGEDKNLEGALR